jgi:preprotein translocase subunit SecA
MSPSLSVVANNDVAAKKTETVAERVRALQAEAKQLAKDHIHALTAAMADAERLAAEIAEGGDAYPAGVRDLARRFAEDCEARVQTLEAITARA